jgi:hypothetical protein
MELSAHDIGVGKAIALLCYERYAKPGTGDDAYRMGKQGDVSESNDLEYILSMLDTTNQRTWIRLLLALHQETPARIRLLAWASQWPLLEDMINEQEGVTIWTR